MLAVAPSGEWYPEHRQQFGRALEAYVYAEFSGASGLRGALGTRASWLFRALYWALAAMAGGLWLLNAGADGADERVGATLLLLGLGVAYAVLFGTLFTWLFLKSFGWCIREGFESHALVRAVAILHAPVVFLRSEDRDALLAWRADLESLSERHGGSWLLDKPWGVDIVPRLLALVAVPLVFTAVLGGTDLLDRVYLVTVSLQGVLAVTSGTALVLAARLIRRANNALYRSTLQDAMSDLADRFREPVGIDDRSHVPLVTSLGRVGLALICVGIAAGVIENLL